MADRVEGYTTSATKVREGGDIMEMVHDPAVVAALTGITSLLTQIAAKMDEQTLVLRGIRARLDGGIKTQAGAISVNV